MDNSLFFKSNQSEVKEEYEIQGVESFKFPKGHEREGEIIPWIIKKITVDKMEELTELCTTRRVKSGEKIVETDTKRLGELVFAEAIVFPNIKDRDLQQQYGAIDSVSLLRKLAPLAVDYGRIFKECNAINNIQDQEDDEIIEEAKN